MPHRFFTVDEAAAYQPGLVLGLFRFADISPPVLQQHVDVMFPTGVTLHGERYFLKNGSSPTATSPAIEILFEYVRRAHFPDKPSRMQSLFGAASPEESIAFRDQFRGGKGAIWEVEVDDYFRADMSLLTHQGSVLTTSYRAHLYWSGQTLPPDTGIRSFWEILLVPPVRTIRVVVEEPTVDVPSVPSDGTGMVAN